MIELGLKTDPIDHRYSFEWLFDLLRSAGVRYVQVGSFFELYSLDESWFVDLRRAAEKRGLQIKSVFTAHRELGGFFTGDVRLERVARTNYERLIRAAAAIGADFVGSNPGAIYRDRPETKAAGIACYLRHMRDLQTLARGLGLKALTVEPMSCLGEPPSTPDEITHMMTTLNEHHAAHRDTTVPVWLCGDISHGVCDAEKRVVHSNVDLFVHEAPWLAEFHFKNTDAIYHSTFGFSAEERKRGCVDLVAWRDLIARVAPRFPVQPVVGYLEIGGPKVGRDYTDGALGKALEESLAAIQSVFGRAAV
jgi:ribulose-phosphate 3-epimerase